MGEGRTTKSFFIPEPDLALLERSLAVLHDCASMSPSYKTADVQVAVEEAKRIVSDVRWGYGPYSQVEFHPGSPLATESGDE